MLGYRWRNRPSDHLYLEPMSRSLVLTPSGHPQLEATSDYRRWGSLTFLHSNLTWYGSPIIGLIIGHSSYKVTPSTVIVGNGRTLGYPSSRSVVSFTTVGVWYLVDTWLIHAMSYRTNDYNHANPTQREHIEHIHLNQTRKREPTLPDVTYIPALIRCIAFWWNVKG